jgi:alpha-beta hydrolase superfamily lysophospholipase
LAWVCLTVVAAVVLGAWSPKGAGQEALAAAPPVKPPPAPKEDLPEPIELGANELRTDDGVILHATFFPSPKVKEGRGKDAVPVILLHGWKGQRTDYANLARYLQGAGHAVLVPDLRGHGQSTTQRLGTESATLDAERMPPAQFVNMVRHDMETLKSFIVQKNNAGQVNLEKLCLVGADVGALVALNWAVTDWAWPIYPGLKQGQYVKALVLLSPPWAFKGLDVRPATASLPVRSQLSIYILAGGEGKKAFSDAQRLNKMLERYHPEPPEKEIEARKDLWFKRLETEAQGTALLEDPLVAKYIADFIDRRLVKQDFPWMHSGKKPPSRPQ